MKILLITYYFPPCGGAPVQRWLRFIPQLLERGCEITVLCSENGDYPHLDHALLDTVPPSVKVIRAHAPGWQRHWQSMFGTSKALPYGRISRNGGVFYKTLIWLRMNVIVPDLRVFWNPYALRAAKKELQKGHYDIVITTGPPHSSHLMGLTLQKRFAVDWFADFRDPWTDIHYLKLNPPSWLTMLIHKYLETKVLARATGSLVVSQAIANKLPPGNKRVILNGFDPQDFADLAYQQGDGFRIKYVGQLTAGQDPGILYRLCRAIKREYQLYMIGTRLSHQEEHELIVNSRNRALFTPFMNHKAALKEMVEAELLLMIVNDYEGNSGMLTTKLFEYLASRSPILCFSPKSSAAARILETFDGTKVFQYDQIEEAAMWVDSLALGYRTSGDLNPYSVQNQSDSLINVLQAKNID